MGVHEEAFHAGEAEALRERHKSAVSGAIQEAYLNGYQLFRSLTDREIAEDLNRYEADLEHLDPDLVEELVRELRAEIETQL